MSSTFAGNLRISIFGQSHSDGIGVVIDGLPSGEEIDLCTLQTFLDRRAPGRNDCYTPRRESDTPEILSGLVNSRTCGAPLSAVIRNTNQRSADYDELRDIPRPGHADYAAHVKYAGFQDVAGGGHFSGRLTAPLCIAGGVCMQLLARRGIYIGAHLLRVAGISDRAFDPVSLTQEELQGPGRKPFPVLDDASGEAMRQSILSAREKLDSVGGVIECAAIGVPAGLGNPMFDGMENRISRIAFAVPAVKAVEFGAGFAAADMLGSQNNDPFYMDGGSVRTRSNHAGGILGGITSGMPLIFRTAVKPTPSIPRRQDSISLSRRENACLAVRGRHDPCIAPRAVPCMEAVMAIAITDALLEKDR